MFFPFLVLFCLCAVRGVKGVRVREGNKVGACTGALCRGEKIYLGLPFPLPLYLLSQRNSPCYASPSFLPALLPFIESAAPSVSLKANPLILESPPPPSPRFAGHPSQCQQSIGRPHTPSHIFPNHAHEFGVLSKDKFLYPFRSSSSDTLHVQ